MPLSGGRLLALLLAFAIWIGIGQVALPAYSQVLMRSAAAVLSAVQPGDRTVTLIDEYPWMGYRFKAGEIEDYNRVPFDLFVYNAALYLTLVSAFPGLTLRGRLVFAVTAAPLVVVFHVADMTLAIEGRLLAAMRPRGTPALQDFSLWFSLVKLYNHMSIMAVKQIVFVGLFFLQWLWLPRWLPAHHLRRASGEGAA